MSSRSTPWVLSLVAVFALGGGLGFWLGTARSAPPAESAAPAVDQADSPEPGGDPVPPSPNATTVSRAYQPLTPSGVRAAGPESLRLQYKSVEFAPPRALGPVTRDDWDQSSALSSYAGYMTANRKQNRDWMVDSFVPSQRDDVRREMTEETMTRHAAFAAQIESDAVLEVIEYGRFRLMVTEATLTGGRKHVYAQPMERVDGQWYATRALAKDPIMRGFVPAVTLWYQEQGRKP